MKQLQMFRVYSRNSSKEPWVQRQAVTAVNERHALTLARGALKARSSDLAKSQLHAVPLGDRF